MANVTLSNIGGFVVLLLAYGAFYPIMEKAIQILLPQLGTFEGLIVRAIPLVLALAIVSEIWEDDNQQFQPAVRR